MAAVAVAMATMDVRKHGAAERDGAERGDAAERGFIRVGGGPAMISPRQQV